MEQGAAVPRGQKVVCQARTRIYIPKTLAVYERAVGGHAVLPLYSSSDKCYRAGMDHSEAGRDGSWKYCPSQADGLERPTWSLTHETLKG